MAPHSAVFITTLNPFIRFDVTQKKTSSLDFVLVSIILSILGYVFTDLQDSPGSFLVLTNEDGITNSSGLLFPLYFTLFFSYFLCFFFFLGFSLCQLFFLLLFPTLSFLLSFFLPSSLFFFVFFLLTFFSLQMLTGLCTG